MYLFPISITYFLNVILFLVYYTIFKTFENRLGKIQETPMYLPFSSRNKILEAQLNPLYASCLLDRACYFLRNYFLRDPEPRCSSLLIFARPQKWPLLLWSLCCQSSGWPHDFWDCGLAMFGLWPWFLSTFPLAGCHLEVPPPECSMRRPKALDHSSALWEAGEAIWTWGRLDSLRRKGHHSWSLSPTVTTLCCRMALTWASAGVEGRSSCPSTWPLLSRTSL